MVMEVFRFDDPTSFDTRPLRTVLTHASNDVPLAVAKVVLDRAVTELTVGGRRD